MNTLMACMMLSFHREELCLLLPGTWGSSYLDHVISTEGNQAINSLALTSQLS